MTTEAFRFDPGISSEGARSSRSGEVRSARSGIVRHALAQIRVGEPVRVVALALEGELGNWLRAVGISEGEGMTVLRRAAFGGPIHVRTQSGGEFALNRSLARDIHVHIVSNEAEPAP